MEKNTEVLTDVLVIGAGPVGLSLASELARHGVRARIVDKTAGTKDISKALILHARTQEVQHFMGVLSASQAEAKPLRRIEAHAYGRRLGSLHQGVDSPYPNALILGQNRTEHILEEHLKSLGGRVEWNVEATRFAQDAEGAAVILRHADGREEEAHARYVVGCEGSNSLVRQALGLAFEGEKYTGEQFIQADCKIRWTRPVGSSHLFLTEEGYMMVIEMPGDLVRVFISLPDTPGTRLTSPGDAAKWQGQPDTTPPTLQEVQDALNRLGHTDAELFDPVWLARYRTSHRAAPRFHEGRAFLAGDAGHVHVPLGGQGMNTGIQDAFNLAWKLAAVAKRRASPALLDSYNAERHPVAEALLHGTDVGYRRILHPSDLLQSLVRRFGPFVVRQEAVQRRIQNTLEETQIAYSDSPLTEDYGGSGGPAAGERAPDALAVRLEDKETVRLFDLLRWGGWTLLLFAGSEPDAAVYQSLQALSANIEGKYSAHVRSYIVTAGDVPPSLEVSPASILMDRECFLHEGYGVSRPCVYLLRPDGYVGLRSREKDSDPLLAYLDRVFLI